MPEHTIPSIDVPQQDDLAKVRAIVGALHSGVPHNRLVGISKLTTRHVGYTRHAARVLGWLERTKSGWRVTSSGEELLGFVAGSAEEKAWIRAQMEANFVIRTLAPDLLENEPPSEAELAERLVDRAGLSATTAVRRTMSLLAWRAQLVVEREVEPEPVEEPPAAAGEPAQLSLWD